MSPDGDRIEENVNGLQSYIKLLFEGGGDASKMGGPMGKQFFLKTGAKCRDKKTGEQVSRSIYINNIPVENTPLSAGFNLMFGGAQGLIPGILNNTENINPMGIFGAFMAGTNPVTKKGANCISGFQNINEEKDYSDKLEIIENLLVRNDYSKLNKENIIAYIYLISLIFAIFYISKK